MENKVIAAEEPQLLEIAARAKKAAKDFETVYEYLKAKKPSKYLENYLKDDISKSYDTLNVIACELHSASDGRPKPLELREDDEFAVCDSRGNPYGLATIEGHSLTHEELLSLKNWIDQVIEWHSASGRSKK